MKRRITYEMSEKERKEVRRENRKYEKGVDGLKKEDFFKYDKSGNRIGSKTTDSQFAPKGHNYSFPSEKSVDETISTYNKEKNKSIARRRVDNLETKEIERPDIKLTETAKELPKPKLKEPQALTPVVKKGKQIEEDYFYSSGGYTQALIDEIKGNDTIDTYSRRYKGAYDSKRSTHTPEGGLKYTGSYSKRTGKELPKRKSYETGVKNIAMNNNEAAVLRKLHGQNGNFGDNLEQVPLIGKGLSYAANNIQGWGKAQYARNESIADRNMNRLSQQAWGMQEQFRPTGMRNSITNTQFGNQDYNDLEDTFNNTARKGKESVKDKALIEVEKDELIFRKEGKSPYKLVGDMAGGKTHEQGGEKVIAKEGDVIFPGKDRDLVLPLMNNKGEVVDDNRFQKLRNRLPEDKPSNLKQEQAMAKKNPNGKIIGTGMSFEKGAFRLHLDESRKKEYENDAKSKRTGTSLVPILSPNSKKLTEEALRLYTEGKEGNFGSKRFESLLNKIDNTKLKKALTKAGSSKAGVLSSKALKTVTKPLVTDAPLRLYDYTSDKLSNIGKASDYLANSKAGKLLEKLGNAPLIKPAGELLGKAGKVLGTAAGPTLGILGIGNAYREAINDELEEKDISVLRSLSKGTLKAMQSLMPMQQSNGLDRYGNPTEDDLLFSLFGTPKTERDRKKQSDIGSDGEKRTPAKSTEIKNPYPSDYAKDLAERNARISKPKSKEVDDYVDVPQASVINTSSGSGYIPRYNKPISAKRFELELEPTTAEKEQVMKYLGGDYDEYKKQKIKHLRELGVDLSEYEGSYDDEGNNDISTFYNLYYDKKRSKDSKLPVKPFKVEDYEEAYTDESRPPFIMRNGSKNLKMYPHGSRKMMIGSKAHELAEIKDFNKIENIVDRLESMHKGLGYSKKKAERGIRSIKGRYSSKYTKPEGVVRYGMQLEPTEKEIAKYGKVRPPMSPYAEFKTKKIRELEKGVLGEDGKYKGNRFAINRYRGSNDIETFDNMYHDRPTLTADEALAIRESNKKIEHDYDTPGSIDLSNSNLMDLPTIPKQRNMDRPIDKILRRAKGLFDKKSESNLTDEETWKERRERGTKEAGAAIRETGKYVKDKAVELFKKDIPGAFNTLFKKKAEYGMRSVNGDPYAAPQPMFPQNPYDNRGVQGAVNDMSNQSDTMPAYKRDIGTMGRVDSQPIQMPPPAGITPTMPTIGEPAPAPTSNNPTKPKTDLGNIFNKGFQTIPLGNSNARRFSFYHGLSRKTGDEYTDRYTDVNGGGNVNQFERGGVVQGNKKLGGKGNATNQLNIKIGGNKAPETRVQRGVTKQKIEVPGASKYESTGATYRGPQATSYDIDAIVNQHKERFKGNKELHDFYSSPEGRKHLLTAGGFDIAPPKLTTAPPTTKEIEVPTETVTQSPGDSGQAAVGQSSSASDATGNSNSQARTTDLGNTQMAGIVDLAGAEVQSKDKGTARQDRKVANKEMRVEVRGQRRYAKGLENAYKDLENREDYKKSSFEQQMAMKERLRDVYHKGNEHWLSDKGLAEKAYGSSQTQGISNIGNVTSGGNSYTESAVSVGSNNSSTSNVKDTDSSSNNPSITEAPAPVNPEAPKPGSSPETSNPNIPSNNNGVAPVSGGGVISSADSNVSNSSGSTAGNNDKGINTPAATDVTTTPAPASEQPVTEDERMRRLGAMAPKLRYGSRRLVGSYEAGTTGVKKDANGNIISGANSNVNTTSTATSGNNVKNITGPNFSGYKAGRPEDPKSAPVPTPAPAPAPSKPIEPGKVGDFNMPNWKKLPKNFDPAMSADDVVAGKTNLYRHNYQDTSNPQRQQIHSLMGGGGFDVAGQLAQEADKARGLDQINAVEQQRLADINKGNTEILNQEKLTNFDQLNSARNAFEQNKGTVEASNYEALMRNNQREQDHPMKEMNYNVGRANYAMMEPMMKAQMEQMRLANEYMAKKANEGPGTTQPFAPAPAPTPAPATPVSDPANAKFVPHNPDDEADAKPPTIMKKGSKKLIIPKKSR